VSQREVPGLGNDTVRLIDATSGNEAYTLPANFAVGRKLVIRRSDSSANSVTISIPSGHSLDGTANATKIVNADSEVWFSLGNPGIWESFGGNSVSSTQLATTSKGNTAAALLARMSRPEAEKLSLYQGTAPVWTASATQTISGGVLRSPRRLVPASGNPTASTDVALEDDPNYNYTGISRLAYGTAFPDYSATQPSYLTGGLSQNARWRGRLSFYYDGQAFEWQGKAVTASVGLRLRIDGKLVSMDYTAIASGLSGGSFYYFKCDLGTAAMRLIEFDFNEAPSFGGIVAEPTATIKRGPSPSLRVCAITDSIGAGAGVYNSQTSWVGILGELMGSDVGMWNVGIGGTGYLAGGAGARFIDRVPDVIASKPDILFVQSQQNDQGNTSAAIKQAAKDFLAAIKTALPKTLLFVIGAYTTGTPTAKRMTDDTALREAAWESGAYFISWVDPNKANFPGSNVPAFTQGVAYGGGDQALDANGLAWTCFGGQSAGSTIDATKWKPNSVFWGTGRVGATTGDGNADVMIQSDGTHPTVKGCYVLGYETFRQLKILLRSIVDTSSTALTS
jgi:lysophospholipase L1-like esterase